MGIQLTLHKIEKNSDVLSKKQIKDFDCNDQVLNKALAGLKKKVNDEVALGYLLYMGDMGGDLVGFASVSLQTLNKESVHQKIGLSKGRLPNVVPVFKIQCFAIDAKFQGQKMGTALLDGLLKACVDKASTLPLIKGVFIDAIHSAEEFYEKLGFEEIIEYDSGLMVEGTTPMFISIGTLKKAKD